MATMAKAPPDPPNVAEVRQRVYALVSEALTLLDAADIDSLNAARLQGALDGMVAPDLGSDSGVLIGDPPIAPRHFKRRQNRDR